MSNITLTRPEVELLRKCGFAVRSQSVKDAYEVKLGLKVYDSEAIRPVLSALSGNNTETKGPRGPSFTPPKTKILTPESVSESKPDRILRETREQDAKRITELKERLPTEPRDARYPLYLELRILEKLRDLPDDQYLHKKNMNIWQWLQPTQKADQLRTELGKHDWIKQLTQTTSAGKLKIFRTILSTDQYDGDIENLLDIRSSLRALRVFGTGTSLPAEYDDWKEKVVNLNGCDLQRVLNDIAIYGHTPKYIRSILQSLDDNSSKTEQQSKKFVNALFTLSCTSYLNTDLPDDGMSDIVKESLTNIVWQCRDQATINIRHNNSVGKKKTLEFFYDIVQQFISNDSLKELLPSEDYHLNLGVIREFISQEIDKTKKI